MDFTFSTIWFHVPSHCPLCNTLLKFRNSIALFCNHCDIKIWSESRTLHTDDWMILLLSYKAGGAMKTLNNKTPHATSNYFWRKISFNLMNNCTFLSSPYNLYKLILWHWLPWNYWFRNTCQGHKKKCRKCRVKVCRFLSRKVTLHFSFQLVIVELFLANNCINMILTILNTLRLVHVQHIKVSGVLSQVTNSIHTTQT